jgi:hypothetical protein
LLGRKRGYFWWWIHDEKIEDNREKNNKSKKSTWQTPRNLPVVAGQGY